MSPADLGAEKVLLDDFGILSRLVRLARLTSSAGALVRLRRDTESFGV